MIHCNTGIKIGGSLTAPSLAMKCMKGSVKDLNKILKLNGPAMDFISQSYFGGRCDAAIPSMNKGFHYDINSMYAAAFCMPMPVGIPNWVEFSTYTTPSDLPVDKIGFYKAKITLDAAMLKGNPTLVTHPFLPFRTEGRILNPVGTWIGTYADIELKFAANLGYEIEIIEGYQFDRADEIFQPFISKYYNIRMLAKKNKNRALEQVAKLIINSAYGRFALGTDSNVFDITVSSEESAKYYEYFNVIDCQESGPDELTLTVKMEMSQTSDTSDDIDPDVAALQMSVFDAAQSAKVDDMNIERNLSIASAITAYARCLLFSYVYANPTCRYQDTDSVFVENDIHPDDKSNFVLGKMKLENEVQEGWFATAKLYSYKNQNGETTFKGKGISKNQRANMGIEIIKSVIQTAKPISTESQQWLRDRHNHKITTRDIQKVFGGMNLKKITVTNDDRNEVVAFLPLIVIHDESNIMGYRHVLDPCRMTVSELHDIAKSDPEAFQYISMLKAYTNLIKSSPTNISPVDDIRPLYSDYKMNHTEIMDLEPASFKVEMDSPLMWAPRNRQFIREDDKPLAKRIDLIETVCALPSFQIYRDANGLVDIVKVILRGVRSIRKYLYTYAFMSTLVSKEIAMPEYKDPVDEIEAKFRPILRSFVLDSNYKALTIPLGEKHGVLPFDPTGLPYEDPDELPTWKEAGVIFKEVTGWLADLDNAFQAPLDPNFQWNIRDQIEWEDRCMSRSGAGNPGLKFDIFVTTSFYPIIAHLSGAEQICTNMNNLLAPIRILIENSQLSINRTDFLEIVKAAKILDEKSSKLSATKSKIIKRTKGFKTKDTKLVPMFGNKYIDLVNAVSFRAFGVQADEDSVNEFLSARNSLNLFIDERLASFIFGSPATLPMVVPPRPYKVGSTGLILGQGGFEKPTEEFNLQPYYLHTTTPVHASFAQIQSSIRPSIARSMNHAMSIPFQIAPSDFLFRNYIEMGQMETALYGPERIQITQQSVALLNAYSRDETQEYALPQFPIYFPTFVDYRGRLYYYGGLLQPQTINLVRAHIEVHDRSEIENSMLPLFFTFIANELGIGGSFYNKIAYVRDTIIDSLKRCIRYGVEDQPSAVQDEINKNKTKFNLITAQLDRPRAMMTLWIAGLVKDMDWDTQATWSIVECCRTLFRRYLLVDDDEQEIFNQIIYSDAAQSGSQIISLLTDDLELQEAVNIHNAGDLLDVPKDYYWEILNFMRREHEMIFNKTKDQANKMIRRKGGGITDPVTVEEFRSVAYRSTRKTVKRNVMTIPYNLTIYGGIEQLLQDFPEEISNRDACILAVMIRSAVFASYPQLEDFLSAASSHVKNTADEPVFIETQFIKSKVDMRRPVDLELSTGSEVSVEGNMPDKRRILAAHAPNIVHAVDASIVHWAQNLASMIIHVDGTVMPLVTIHDSFGTSFKFIEYLPIVQRLATYLAIKEFKEKYLKPNLSQSNLTEGLGLKDLINIMTSPYNYDLPILTEDEREDLGNILNVCAMVNPENHLDDNGLLIEADMPIPYASYEKCFDDRNLVLTMNAQRKRWILRDTHHLIESIIEDAPEDIEAEIIEPIKDTQKLLLEFLRFAYDPKALAAPVEEIVEKPKPKRPARYVPPFEALEDKAITQEEVDEYFYGPPAKGFGKPKPPKTKRKKEPPKVKAEDWTIFGFTRAEQEAYDKYVEEMLTDDLEDYDMFGRNKRDRRKMRKGKNIKPPPV